MASRRPGEIRNPLPTIASRLLSLIDAASKRADSRAGDCAWGSEAVTTRRPIAISRTLPLVDRIGHLRRETPGGFLRRQKHRVKAIGAAPDGERLSVSVHFVDQEPGASSGS